MNNYFNINYEFDKLAVWRKIDEQLQKEEPHYIPKSYFTDEKKANACFASAMKAIDQDNYVWYIKSGGERKLMCCFKNVVGKTENKDTGEMEDTRWVTVTYSRDNGFHCYPDSTKGKKLRKANDEDER